MKMKPLILSFLLTIFCLVPAVGQTTINMEFTQNPLFTVSTNDVTAVVDGTPLELGADIVIEGGSGNYTYRWYTSSQELGSEPTLTVETGGKYYLDVNDECDCLQTVTFHITDPAGIDDIAAENVRQVVVFTEQGQLVKVFNSADYDLSSLPKGVYIVNKVDANGKASATKVLNN